MSMRSNFSESEELFLDITDIKHYFYCPKIIYFDKVLRVKPHLDSQQKSSKQIHNEIAEKESKRKSVLCNQNLKNKKKIYNVYLFSENLKLQGEIDCLLQDDTEYSVIEYKNTMSNKGKIWEDHFNQVVAYSILVDEYFNTDTKLGFVYYRPEDLMLSFNIRNLDKQKIHDIIAKIKFTIENEIEPMEEIPPNRCSGGCGYLWICGGVWTR